MLLKAFPDLQCFPVGQPDGGRDATARLLEVGPDSPGFILFQVKFARRELSPSEARKWLLKTLKNELPKIREQIELGAEGFVLVTNVSGTAHPKAGSIDKLQKLLDEHIPINAQAWWRDELDRRLDDAWDLKFAHPALFTGTDYLRLVVEASPSEGRQRRQNSISAFLADQFQSDREVKFKQVELENDIFDLFTDVPVVPLIPAVNKTQTVDRLAAAFRRAASSTSGEAASLQVLHWLDIASRGESRFGHYYPREEAWLGTASLLLDSDFQQAEPLVILEGAPGQGKSTIAQYICQVHRMRFLAKPQGSAVVPAHLNSSIRLPFKVELRDFATWLSGGNPFGAVNDGESSDASPRSLEGFLTSLIRHASGGSSFDVSDLQVTLSSSPALVVLDGLDEVAEIRQRERVVEEITSAVARMTAVAASLQVVVTSRPTPFVNSKVLPSTTFATYSLGSLTRQLISEYADRWLKSRAIGESEASDVRRILDSKLDEPHLRDLARNPMQLAILLSLIDRRGVSLPDKRTNLYDSYVEIFFDRESEKAAVVKENRDLLIRIHRYLAWILQSGAEVAFESPSKAGPFTPSHSGTIAEGDLKRLLREFLERDGSNPDLVEELFSGMVERVVAIVSRVQGSYEFDVQTLREYFAARHLYQTAPYSPAGDERRGTISDRWRAIARNYYWFNVARFYAGCYSEGELSSLVDDLRSLCNDEVFSRTSHPQLLTAALLGDWVFSQRPRAIQDAVDLILEPRGLRMLVAGTGLGLHHGEDVIVRDPAGKSRLVAACKSLVSPNRPADQVMDIVRSVLRPNADPAELFEWWIGELNSANRDQVNQWCAIGELLQCWSIVDLGTVNDLLAREEVPTGSVIAGLLHASRMDLLESNEELFEAAVERVLAGDWVGWSPSGSPLYRLALAVERRVLGGHDLGVASTRRLSLREYLRRFSGEGQEEEAVWPHYTAAEHCAPVVKAFAQAADRPVTEWKNSVEPWDMVVQQGTSEFGERAVFVELANIAAGIGSREDSCQDSPNLFDFRRPLVRRARYARLRAGSTKWWSKHLQLPSNPDEVQMALLLFATWAGPRTIENLATELDRHIVCLEDSEWRRLYSSLRMAVDVNSERPWIKPLGIRVSALPSSLSARIVALLSERCTTGVIDKLHKRYLTGYSGGDAIVISLCADVQIRRALKDKTKWSQAVTGVRSSYGQGVSTNRDLYRLRSRRPALPDSVAKEVVTQPLEFPAVLVRVAEERCRQLDAKRISPVSRVADDEGWFND